MSLTLEAGSFSMRGARPTMEDEHLSIEDLSEDFPEQVASFSNPRAFFAIYDGHRGSRASEFLVETLHLRLFESDQFRQGEVEKAIYDSFLQTDKELLVEAGAHEEPWQDGSTAAIAIFLGQKVYTGNVGDAEVLLGRLKEGATRGESGYKPEDYECVVLTHKHSPSDPVEKARIVEAGGIVLGGRVGGALAVARSFGDLEFKVPVKDESLGIEMGKLLSEEPHISCTELIPNRDLFVIVGCDGVWEKLPHDDSVKFVAKYLEEEGPEATSEMLANHAFNMRSMDNISTTIIQLKWEKEE